MDRKAIAERLRMLATDDMKRSKAARLRDVIDDVEFALSAGVSRQSVINALKEQGLELSLATFETTLKRIRQKSKTTTSKTSSQSSFRKNQRDIDPVKEPQLPENGLQNPDSHNPAALDKIIGNTPNLGALAKLAKGTKK